MSFDRLVEMIAENDSTLTRVNLDGECIDDVGSRKIAKALLTNTTVKEIDLGFNIIGNDGARALAEVLPLNASLITLDLGMNAIGDEGAQALAEALPRNSTLVKLYLGCSYICEEGARALAEALRNNTTLTMLDLEGNGIGAEGARALADTLHLHNHSLESLGPSFRPADDDLRKKMESYLEINRTSNRPVGAYIRKTRLFPKSHLGNLTTKSATLPIAVQHLGNISGGLSIIFCLVRETHTALLAFKNGVGMRKKERILVPEQAVE